MKQYKQCKCRLESYLLNAKNHIEHGYMTVNRTAQKTKLRFMVRIVQVILLNKVSFQASLKVELGHINWKHLFLAKYMHKSSRSAEGIKIISSMQRPHRIGVVKIVLPDPIQYKAVSKHIKEVDTEPSQERGCSNSAFTAAKRGRKGWLQNQRLFLTISKQIFLLYT